MGMSAGSPIRDKRARIGPPVPRRFNYTHLPRPPSDASQLRSRVLRSCAPCTHFRFQVRTCGQATIPDRLRILVRMNTCSILRQTLAFSALHGHTYRRNAPNPAAHISAHGAHTVTSTSSRPSFPALPPGTAPQRMPPEPYQPLPNIPGPLK